MIYAFVCPQLAARPAKVAIFHACNKTQHKEKKKKKNNKATDKPQCVQKRKKKVRNKACDKPKVVYTSRLAF